LLGTFLAYGFLIRVDPGVFKFLPFAYGSRVLKFISGLSILLRKRVVQILILTWTLMDFYRDLLSKIGAVIWPSGINNWIILRIGNWVIWHIINSPSSHLYRICSFRLQVSYALILWRILKTLRQIWQIRPQIWNTLRIIVWIRPLIKSPIALVNLTTHRFKFQISFVQNVQKLVSLRVVGSRGIKIPESP
jgi:hypothetical protein